MKLKLAVLAGMLALSACQTVTPMQTSFSQADASFINSTGSGAIAGQAFMRQVGGGVVTAAGENVLLIPDQPYTRELAQRFEAGASAPGEENPVKPYTKSTIADAAGNFRFAGLAAGNYIVLTKVQWGAPSQYGMLPQGGFLASRVSVSSGQISEVILRR